MKEGAAICSIFSSHAAITMLLLLLVTLRSTDAVTGGTLMNNTEIYGSSANLTEPTVLSTQTGFMSITLRVRAYRFTSGIFSFNTRAYCYDSDDAEPICSIPGPTIQVYPGDRVNLTLINDLAADTAHGTMNTLHAPNTTNLHTHGVRIGPSIDNVFIKVSGGGDSHTYVYDIPPEHAPGIHWYHSHYHGASTMQVTTSSPHPPHFHM